MADVAQPGPSNVWELVLDRVQRALAQAEAAATEREKIALDFPTGVAHDSVALRHAETGSQSWQNRLRDLQERVDLAVAELAADEDAFVHWQAELQGFGQYLAQSAGRVIK
jgi:hypothetical protein